MTARSLIDRISGNDRLNFFFTNRIPRRLATRFVGWFSRIEQPLIRDASIGIWRLFCDINLDEAKKTSFSSLRDCFIRELKDGARPINPDPQILISPCDAIVGAFGLIEGSDILQVKGSSYPLAELLRDRDLAKSYRGGCYVTLRLTAAMYHHFHAPHDCHVRQVTHIWGDTWNVNPPTLKRVQKLFCKNERAIIRTTLDATGQCITLVPVAAILVAGIRLRFQDLVVNPRKSRPPASCNVPFRKGEEMGWFEHGSTIVVLAPRGVAVADTIQTGSPIRMGETLMRISA